MSLANTQGMTNLLSKVTFLLLSSGLAIGCLDAPPDDDAPDGRWLGTHTIGTSTGIFEVVGFDATKLRLTSSSMHSSCQAAPCVVAAEGLMRPLDSAADSYLVGGALMQDGTIFHVSRVWRGTRTWADGSGELFNLTYADGVYNLCRVYPMIGNEFHDAGRTESEPARTWHGGARLVVPQAPSLDITEVSTAEGPNAAPQAGRCTKLRYVVTNIAGQDALANAFVQGDVFVRAAPAFDGQGDAFAHLGMVYASEPLHPHSL